MAIDAADSQMQSDWEARIKNLETQTWSLHSVLEDMGVLPNPAGLSRAKFA